VDEFLECVIDFTGLTQRKFGRVFGVCYRFYRTNLEKMWTSFWSVLSILHD